MNREDELQGVIDFIQEENEQLKQEIKEIALESIGRYQRTLSNFNTLEAENDWLKKRIGELEEYIKLGWNRYTIDKKWVDGLKDKKRQKNI